MIYAARSMSPPQDAACGPGRPGAPVKSDTATEKLERQLKKLTERAEREAERATDLERQLERAQHDVVELSRAFIRETQLREAAQEELARKEAEIAMLRNSTSWRVTGPLRGIRLALGRRG